MTQTITLITGGNRGLGEGLVKRFLAQTNQVSMACCLSRHASFCLAPVHMLPDRGDRPE